MRRIPIASAIRFWSFARGFATDQIRREMERPVSIALVGKPEEQDAVVARLANEPGGSTTPSAVLATVTTRFADPLAAKAAGAAILIDCGDAANRSEQEFSALLGNISAKHPDLRLALAGRIPAFRPVVISQLTAQAAKENARIAALSALPGVIPLTDWLVPATAAGDLFLLTKNQVNLLLQIAACYGLPPDLKARLRELLPVVGGAFGWRAVARELIGLVPGGVGLVVKASVAYAGTLAVGRAAAYYYASGGHALSTADMRRLYRQAIGDAVGRARSLVPYGKTSGRTIGAIQGTNRRVFPF